MTPAQIQTLFAYHYASFERVWACVAQLSHEQFMAQSSYSVGSIRNQMAHCLIVDIRWLARLQGQTPPELAYEDYPDRATLQREWAVMSQQVMDYITSLTQAEIDAEVALHFPDRGGSRLNPRWQILLHVVNHGTDHRAQILAQLHEFGAATFEQDLMLHLWAQD